MENIMENLNKNSTAPFYNRFKKQFKSLHYWSFQFDLFSKYLQEDRNYDKLSNSYYDAISQFQNINQTAY